MLIGLNNPKLLGVYHAPHSESHLIAYPQHLIFQQIKIGGINPLMRISSLKRRDG